ncbi:hypothetical protein ACIQVK_31010 [Streptomyces sp. NPDC090493]|uniref:hypothetical protein n=1 Tax=Streptomyces sp. NPDC090493 TaxID=3365964 RepID=UPI00380D2641
MKAELEVANLRRTQVSPEELGAGVVRVAVDCYSEFKAAESRHRVIEALEVILRSSDLGADDTREWQARLPAWLLERFAPPKTPQQADEWLATWRRLPPLERKQFELSSWDLPGWINWFTEEDRAWHWLGSRVDSETTFTIFLSVEGWPFAWQALEWLIIQAGGTPKTID